MTRSRCQTAHRLYHDRRDASDAEVQEFKFIAASLAPSLRGAIAAVGIGTGILVEKEGDAVAGDDGVMRPLEEAHADMGLAEVDRVRGIVMQGDAAARIDRVAALHLRRHAEVGLLLGEDAFDGDLLRPLVHEVAAAGIARREHDRRPAVQRLLAVGRDVGDAKQHVPQGQASLPRRLRDRDLVQELGDLRPDPGDRLAVGCSPRREGGEREEQQGEGEEWEGAVREVHADSRVVGWVETSMILWC